MLPAWRKLEEVGPQADGSTLLVSGWSLRPAGRQVQLDTMPMASVLTPDGKYLTWTSDRVPTQKGHLFHGKWDHEKAMKSLSLK